MPHFYNVKSNAQFPFNLVCQGFTSKAIKGRTFISETVIVRAKHESFFDLRKYEKPPPLVLADEEPIS